jgi:ATP-dependent helicase YprA (DUF1998 family)
MIDRYILPSSQKRKYRRKAAPKPKADPSQRKLTRRQELFVQEMVTKDGFITQVDAAINAGYPPKSARVRASELMNPNRYPNVALAIQNYRDELNKKYAVTYHRHLKDLHHLREESLSNGAYSASVQAEKLRGQIAGLYVSKSEVRYGSIDSMSKEEVEKALEEIKSEYAPITYAGSSDEEGEPVLELPAESTEETETEMDPDEA